MHVFVAIVFALAAYTSVGSQPQTTPVKVRLSHILIKIEASEAITHADALAAARKRAEFVLMKARGGANFGGLAKQYSADALTAGRGGSLGWVRRGQFVAPFEDAAFSLKKGQISGIVQTDFGFHILRVDEIALDHEIPVQVARKELWAQLPPSELAPAVVDVPKPRWPRPDHPKEIAVGTSTEELRAICARASTDELQQPAHPNSSDPASKSIAYECSILAIVIDDEYERLVDRAVLLQKQLCIAGNGSIPESRPTGAQFASDWDEAQRLGAEWMKRNSTLVQELTIAERVEADERKAEWAELDAQLPNWEKGYPSQQDMQIRERISKSHRDKIANLEIARQNAKAKALRLLLDLGRVYSNCGHGW